jgi:hypothetical protein
VLIGVLSAFMVVDSGSMLANMGRPGPRRHHLRQRRSGERFAIGARIRCPDPWDLRHQRRWRRGVRLARRS